MSAAYQLLALDSSESTRCENATGLLYTIRGFTKLWKSPTVNETACKITDKNTVLSIVAAQGPHTHTAATTDALGRAFIITLSGNENDIAPLREPLAAFLKDQDFELVYVLRDQVSEQIACKLYPHLYRIENLLRGYLIRFMATHIGPGWWEVTASSEMTDKAKLRKKNEPVFGKHIENSAYLIDFDELGEIVYEQSSGFLTREDIIDRVSGLADTPEAIKALKQELQSNYFKLFKESFADKNFKDKWKQFEKLRNKIAHNNLFTTEDLETGERLAKEITEIISAADAEATKLVITNEEREAIQEKVIARIPLQPQITRELFLAELDSLQATYTKRNHGFVGLTRFRSHLGTKGCSYGNFQQMVDQLTKAGLIEIYYVPNPYEDVNPTAAIRRPPPDAGSVPPPSNA